MRDVGLDYLKLIMSIMVVGIHVGFLSYHDHLLSSVFAQGLFRIAVPVFFIINGFYLYETFVNNKESKVFSYLLGLFLIWQFVYSYFYIGLASENFGSFLLTFLMGYNHLWYISALIVGVVFVRFVSGFSTRRLATIALCLFVVGCFMQYGDVYGFIPFESGYLYYRNALFMAFPFLIIGFLFRRFEKQGGQLFQVTWLHLIAACALIMLESVLNFQYHGEIKGYDIPFGLIVTAPIVFLFFYQKFPKRQSTLSKDIATYSTGIYLIHPWFNYFIHTQNMPHGTLTKFILSSCLSALTVYLFLLCQKTIRSFANTQEVAK
jgi:surface polysaccharide O-acyltransferase-like enzyme